MVSEGKTLAFDGMEVWSGKNVWTGVQGARVQVGTLSGKSRKNEGYLALNRATSRRSGQRRDVPEKKVF